MKIMNSCVKNKPYFQQMHPLKVKQDLQTEVESKNQIYARSYCL